MPSEIRIGMLGLDNAGKTTLLYKLTENMEHEEIIPTIGFNVETIRFKQYLLNIWDVGGSKPKSRILWQHYNEKSTKAIIFVIDATDLQRLPIAANELNWLWWSRELSQAVFLIFANKQDLTQQALSGQQIADILNLKNAPKYHAWVVQDCCALTGEGVEEGLQKLMQLYERQQTKTRCLKR
ncbi:uncharacterized protein ACRADG_006478 [Cochliomyia hominivorax]